MDELLRRMLYVSDGEIEEKLEALRPDGDGARHSINCDPAHVVHALMPIQFSQLLIPKLVRGALDRESRAIPRFNLRHNNKLGALSVFLRNRRYWMWQALIDFCAKLRRFLVAFLDLRGLLAADGEP